MKCLWIIIGVQEMDQQVMYTQGNLMKRERTSIISFKWGLGVCRKGGVGHTFLNFMPSAHLLLKVSLHFEPKCTSVDWIVGGLSVCGMSVCLSIC